MSAGRPTSTAAAALVALLVAACGSGDAGARPGEDGGTAGAAGREVETAVDRAAQDSAGPVADTVPEAEDGDAVLPVTTLRVGGHDVRAEIADDEEERRRGLMHRDSLPDDHGMLFVYGEEQTLSFWMRNTKIPLDVAYVDRNGTIVDIRSMDPQTDQLYRSRQPAMYALEMNRGWFREHGVEVGDRVEF